jgi:hypothetical protein
LNTAFDSGTATQEKYEKRHKSRGQFVIHT